MIQNWSSHILKMRLFIWACRLQPAGQESCQPDLFWGIVSFSIQSDISFNGQTFWCAQVVSLGTVKIRLGLGKCENILWVLNATHSSFIIRESVAAGSWFLENAGTVCGAGGTGVLCQGLKCRMTGFVPIMMGRGYCGEKNRQVGKLINTGKGFINGKKGHAISNVQFKSASLHSGTVLFIVPQIP